MQKSKIKMTNRKSKIILHFTLSFCVLIFAFFIFGKVEAAILYLNPSDGEYNSGDTFIINVRIDPEQECINAVQADLAFSKDSLEVQDISKGNSIISFWVKEPEFSNEAGSISFMGGMPGGYCGRLPGDPGESNLLGKLIFKVREVEPPWEVQPLRIEFLDTSQVLLNDGLGTPSELTAKGATFD